MEQLTLSDCQAAVERWAAGERRAVVGITGPPGAGKSTIAARLGAQNGTTCAVVPMDGFHLANIELDRLGRRGRKGAPDTFDAAGFVALVERLVQTPDETVYAPLFRRDLEEAIAGAIAVLPAHRVVLIEGNYLLLAQPPWTRLRSLCAAIWYVDVDDALRRARLIARHEAFGRDPSAARAWVAATDDPNAELIAATRAAADAVVRLAE